MPFPYSGIREEIEEWEREGELVCIREELDWNLEIGAITRRSCEVGQGRSVKGGGATCSAIRKC